MSSPTFFVVYREPFTDRTGRLHAGVEILLGSHMDRATRPGRYRLSAVTR